MSVEHYLKLYTKQTERIILRFQRRFPSCEHKVYANGVHWVAAERIVAFVYPTGQQSMEWTAIDYGVRVNHAVAFRYVSSGAVNTPADILLAIRIMVRDTDSDLLYQPNGGEPILMRRKGFMIINEAFDRYFGEGASAILRADNHFAAGRRITEEM